MRAGGDTAWTEDYAYDLPPERIAQRPLADRDAARMMVVDRSSRRWEHRHVRDLPEYVRRNDVLAVNDTRVFPARVTGYRERTGGRVEVLFVEALSPPLWEAMYRGSSRPKPGDRLLLAGGRLRAEVAAWLSNGRLALRVAETPDLLATLEAYGSPPLPPYIRREEAGAAADSDDRARYQTVYAERTGSVAAPTAGLHFTPGLLDRLARRGAVRVAVTLHVGPGTFQPVRAERAEDHVMEAERVEVGAQAWEAVRNARPTGGRVLAVGTTTVRALESVAAGRAAPGMPGRTNLFIRPPYRFQAVDRLLTNFHLPRSTLLMLVSAFAGDAARGDGRELILDAYRDAVASGYRFYSYGDCMLLV